MKWADITIDHNGKTARVYADDGDYHMSHTGRIEYGPGAAICLITPDNDHLSFDDADVELTG